MFNTIIKRKFKNFTRIISSFVVITFSSTLITPVPRVQAQPVPSSLNLPAPGTMVATSPVFFPPVLKGIKIYPEEPFKFNFIVDSGDHDLKGKKLEQESQKLIKYFLASLTIPEEDLWVNLSPYEKDRIIPDEFGTTEMGRDLLAQDYILKQLTSSLIYPEDELGKKFWDKVYKKAQDLYGTTDIPLNTFNKVWIVPDTAVVYENGNVAFVSESHLKVMLEEDYLALKSNLNTEEKNGKFDQKKVEEISAVSSEIVREIILPEIEKEVNEGENFALLRQIYNSLILATWYKRHLQKGLLNQVYVDKGKVTGVDTGDKDAKEKIYQQYLDAYKLGVFNYIKEDYDRETKSLIPRKYFSGGLGFAGNMSSTLNVLSHPAAVPSGVTTHSGSLHDVAMENKVVLQGQAPEDASFVSMPNNTGKVEADAAMVSNMDNLIHVISNESEEGIPYVIGVGGRSGAGKTTFVYDYLEPTLRRHGEKVLVLGMDDFIQSPDFRRSLKVAGNEWGPEHVNLDRVRMTLQNIRALEEIIVIPIPGGRGKSQEEVEINLAEYDIVIFEGLYMINNNPLLENLLEYIDLPIYVDSDTDDVKQRRYRQELEKEHPRSLEEMNHHWDEGILPDTRNNIQPSRANARFIIYSGDDYSFRVEETDAAMVADISERVETGFRRYVHNIGESVLGETYLTNLRQERARFIERFEGYINGSEDHPATLDQYQHELEQVYFSYQFRRDPGSFSAARYWQDLPPWVLLDLRILQILSSRQSEIRAGSLPDVERNFEDMYQHVLSNEDPDQIFQDLIGNINRKSESWTIKKKLSQVLENARFLHTVFPVGFEEKVRAILEHLQQGGRISNDFLLEISDRNLPISVLEGVEEDEWYVMNGHHRLIALSMLQEARAFLEDIEIELELRFSNEIDDVTDTIKVIELLVRLRGVDANAIDYDELRGITGRLVAEFDGSDTDKAMVGSSDGKVVAVIKRTVSEDEIQRLREYFQRVGNPRSDDVEKFLRLLKESVEEGMPLTLEIGVGNTEAAYALAINLGGHYLGVDMFNKNFSRYYGKLGRDFLSGELVALSDPLPHLAVLKGEVKNAAGQNVLEYFPSGVFDRIVMVLPDIDLWNSYFLGHPELLERILKDNGEMVVFTEAKTLEGAIDKPSKYPLTTTFAFDPQEGRVFQGVDLKEKTHYSDKPAVLYTVRKRSLAERARLSESDAAMVGGNIPQGKRFISRNLTEEVRKIFASVSRRYREDHDREVTWAFDLEDDVFVQINIVDVFLILNELAKNAADEQKTGDIPVRLETRDGKAILTMTNEGIPHRTLKEKAKKAARDRKLFHFGSHIEMFKLGEEQEGWDHLVTEAEVDEMSHLDIMAIRYLGRDKSKARGEAGGAGEGFYTTRRMAERWGGEVQLEVDGDKTTVHVILNQVIPPEEGPDSAMVASEAVAETPFAVKGGEALWQELERYVADHDELTPADILSNGHVADIANRFRWVPGRLLPDVEEEDKSTRVSRYLRDRIGQENSLNNTLRTLVSGFADYVDGLAVDAEIHKRSQRQAEWKDVDTSFEVLGKEVTQLVKEALKRKDAPNMQVLATENIGITYRTLKNIMNGRGTNDILVLIKIANEFDRPVDSLFRRRKVSSREFSPYETQKEKLRSRVGPNIRQESVWRGVESQKLARAMGADEKTFLGMEKGKSLPKLRRLLNVAREFNEDLEYFLRERITTVRLDEVEEVSLEQQWVELRIVLEEEGVTNTTTGSYMGEMRDAADVSQEDVGKVRGGISKQAVAYIERGEGEDHLLETVEDYARVYGNSLFYFATGKETKEKPSSIARQRLPRHLARLREIWKLDHIEVAKKVGVTPKLILQWEERNGNVLFSNLIAIARVYMFPPDMLLAPDEEFEAYLKRYEPAVFVTPPSASEGRFKVSAFEKEIRAAVKDDMAPMPAGDRIILPSQLPDVTQAGYRQMYSRDRLSQKGVERLYGRFIYAGNAAFDDLFAALGKGVLARRVGPDKRTQKTVRDVLLKAIRDGHTVLNESAVGEEVMKHIRHPIILTERTRSPLITLILRGEAAKDFIWDAHAYLVSHVIVREVRTALINSSVWEELHSTGLLQGVRKAIDSYRMRPHDKKKTSFRTYAWTAVKLAIKRESDTRKGRKYDPGDKIESLEGDDDQRGPIETYEADDMTVADGLPFTALIYMDRDKAKERFIEILMEDPEIGRWDAEVFWLRFLGKLDLEDATLEDVAGQFNRSREWIRARERHVRFRLYEDTGLLLAIAREILGLEISVTILLELLEKNGNGYGNGDMHRHEELLGPDAAMVASEAVAETPLAVKGGEALWQELERYVADNDGLTPADILSNGHVADIADRFRWVPGHLLPQVNPAQKSTRTARYLRARTLKKDSRNEVMNTLVNAFADYIDGLAATMKGQDKALKRPSMEEAFEILGENVSGLVEERTNRLGINTRTLAGDIGVGYKSLLQIMKGDGVNDIRTILQIANAFERSIPSLLTRGESFAAPDTFVPYVVEEEALKRITGSNIRDVRKSKEVEWDKILEGDQVRESFLRYERGDTLPTVPRLFQLTQKLGENLETFLRENKWARLDEVEEIEESQHLAAVDASIEDGLDNTKIGDNLTILRLSTGKTQGEVGQALGISNGAVAKLENRETEDSYLLENLVESVELYHSSLLFLLTGKEPQMRPGSIKKERLPKRITRLRKLWKLDQSQLADQIGVTQTTVSKMEKGRGNVMFSTFIALVQALRVPPDILLAPDEDFEAYLTSTLIPEIKKRFYVDTEEIEGPRQWTRLPRRGENINMVDVGGRMRTSRENKEEKQLHMARTLGIHLNELEKGHYKNSSSENIIKIVNHLGPKTTIFFLVTGEVSAEDFGILDVNHFGRNVKRLRTLQNLLPRKIDPTGKLSILEENRKSPYVRRAVSIARELRVPPDLLFASEEVVERYIEKYFSPVSASDQLTVLFEDPIYIGAWMREHRETARLSLESMAEDLDVSESSLQRIESGLRVDESLKIAVGYAQRLELPMFSLLSGREISFGSRNKYEYSAVNKYFGRNIRRIMELKGITNGDLAEKLGIAHRTVAWIKSEGLPRVDTFIGIIKALEATVDELLTPDIDDVGRDLLNILYHLSDQEELQEGMPQEADDDVLIDLVYEVLVEGRSWEEVWEKDVLPDNGFRMDDLPRLRDPLLERLSSISLIERDNGFVRPTPWRVQLEYSDQVGIVPDTWDAAMVADAGDQAQIQKSAEFYGKALYSPRDQKRFVFFLEAGRVDEARELLFDSSRSHYAAYQARPKIAVYPAGLDLKIFELFPNLATVHFINIRPFRVPYQVEKLTYKKHGSTVPYEGRQAFDVMMLGYMNEVGYISDDLQERILYPNYSESPQIGIEPFIVANLREIGARDIRVEEVAGESVPVYRIGFTDGFGQRKYIIYTQSDVYGLEFSSDLQSQLKGSEIDLLFSKGFAVFNTISDAESRSSLQFLPLSFYEGLSPQALFVAERNDVFYAPREYLIGKTFDEIDVLGGSETAWGPLGHEGELVVSVTRDVNPGDAAMVGDAVKQTMTDGEIERLRKYFQRAGNPRPDDIEKFLQLLRTSVEQGLPLTLEIGTGNTEAAYALAGRFEGAYLGIDEYPRAEDDKYGPWGIRFFNGDLIALSDPLPELAVLRAGVSIDKKDNFLSYLRPGIFDRIIMIFPDLVFWNVNALYHPEFLERALKDDGELIVFTESESLQDQFIPLSRQVPLFQIFQFSPVEGSLLAGIDLKKITAYPKSPARIYIGKKTKSFENQSDSAMVSVEGQQDEIQRIAQTTEEAIEAHLQAFFKTDDVSSYARIEHAGSTSRGTNIFPIGKGSFDIDFDIYFKRRLLGKMDLPRYAKYIQRDDRLEPILQRFRTNEWNISRNTALHEQFGLKNRNGYFRFYFAVEHPLGDFNVTVNLIPGNEAVYNDVFNQQMDQIATLGGDPEEVLADIRRVKHIFDQEVIYGTGGLPAVGIEQLVIQSGRTEDFGRRILKVGSIDDAMAWILRAGLNEGGDMRPVEEMRALLQVYHPVHSEPFSLTDMMLREIVTMALQYFVDQPDTVLTVIDPGDFLKGDDSDAAMVGETYQEIQRKIDVLLPSDIQERDKITSFIYRLFGERWEDAVSLLGDYLINPSHHDFIEGMVQSRRRMGFSWPMTMAAALNILSFSVLSNGKAIHIGDFPLIFQETVLNYKRGAAGIPKDAITLMWALLVRVYPHWLDGQPEDLRPENFADFININTRAWQNWLTETEKEIRVMLANEDFKTLEEILGYAVTKYDSTSSKPAIYDRFKSRPGKPVVLVPPVSISNLVWQEGVHFSRDHDLMDGDVFSIWLLDEKLRAYFPRSSFDPLGNRGLMLSSVAYYPREENVVEINYLQAWIRNKKTFPQEVQDFLRTVEEGTLLAFEQYAREQGFSRIRFPSGRDNSMKMGVNIAGRLDRVFVRNNYSLVYGGKDEIGKDIWWREKSISTDRPDREGAEILVEESLVESFSDAAMVGGSQNDRSLPAVYSTSVQLFESILSPGRRKAAFESIAPKVRTTDELKRFVGDLITHKALDSLGAVSQSTGEPSEYFDELHKKAYDDFPGPRDVQYSGVRKFEDTLDELFEKYDLDETLPADVDRVAEILFDYYLYYYLSLLSLRIWDDADDPNAKLEMLQRLLDRLQGPEGSGQQFVRYAEDLLLYPINWLSTEVSYHKFVDKVDKTLDFERKVRLSVNQVMTIRSHLSRVRVSMFVDEARLRNQLDYLLLSYFLNILVERYDELTQRDPDSPEREFIATVILLGIWVDEMILGDRKDFMKQFISERPKFRFRELEPIELGPEFDGNFKFDFGSSANEYFGRLARSTVFDYLEMLSPARPGIKYSPLGESHYFYVNFLTSMLAVSLKEKGFEQFGLDSSYLPSKDRRIHQWMTKLSEVESSDGRSGVSVEKNVLYFPASVHPDFFRGRARTMRSQQLSEITDYMASSESILPEGAVLLPVLTEPHDDLVVLDASNRYSAFAQSLARRLLGVEGENARDREAMAEALMQSLSRGVYHAIGNAPRSKRVTVAWRVNNGRITVSVQDRGRTPIDMEQSVYAMRSVRVVPDNGSAYRTTRPEELSRLGSALEEMRGSIDQAEIRAIRDRSRNKIGTELILVQSLTEDSFAEADAAMVGEDDGTSGGDSSPYKIMTSLVEWAERLGLEPTINEFGDRSWDDIGAMSYSNFPMAIIKVTRVHPGGKFNVFVDDWNVLQIDPDGLLGPGLSVLPQTPVEMFLDIVFAIEEGFKYWEKTKRRIESEKRKREVQAAKQVLVRDTWPEGEHEKRVHQLEDLQEDNRKIAGIARDHLYKGLFLRVISIIYRHFGLEEVRTFAALVKFLRSSHEEEIDHVWFRGEDHPLSPFLDVDLYQSEMAHNTDFVYDLVSLNIIDDPDGGVRFNLVPYHLHYERMPSAIDQYYHIYRNMVNEGIPVVLDDYFRAVFLGEISQDEPLWHLSLPFTDRDQGDAAMVGGESDTDGINLLLRRSYPNVAKTLLGLAAPLIGATSDEFQGKVLIFDYDPGVLLEAAQTFPHAEIIGFHPDNDLVERGKEALLESERRLSSRIQLYTADAHNLMDIISDESIQLVLIPGKLDLYEHSARHKMELEQILAEVDRVLNPSGIIAAGFGSLNHSKQFLSRIRFIDIGQSQNQEYLLYQKMASGEASVVLRDDSDLAAQTGLSDRKPQPLSLHMITLETMMRSASRVFSNFSAEEFLSGAILNVGLEAELLGAIKPFNLVSILRSRGLNVIGLDPQAVENIEEGLYSGVVQEMPFKDSSFDLIISVGLFNKEFFDMGVKQVGFSSEYDFYLQAAREIRRVLRPDGKFLLSSGSNPNLAFLRALKEVFEDSEFDVFRFSNSAHYLLAPRDFFGRHLPAGLGNMVSDDPDAAMVGEEDPVAREVDRIWELYKIGDSIRFRGALRDLGIRPDDLIGKMKGHTEEYLRNIVEKIVFTEQAGGKQKRVFESSSLDFLVGFEYDKNDYRDFPPTDTLPESFEIAYERGGDLVGRIFYLRDIRLQYIEYKTGIKKIILVPYLLVQERLTELGDRILEILNGPKESQKVLLMNLKEQFDDIHRRMFARGFMNWDVEVAVNYGLTREDRLVLLDTGGITKIKRIPKISAYMTLPAPFVINTLKDSEELSRATIEDLWETDLDSIVRSTFVNPDLEGPLRGIIESAVRKSSKFSQSDHAMVAGEGEVPVSNFLQEAGVETLEAVDSDRVGGIDFNSSPLKIKVKNRDHRVPILPMPQGEYLEIEGLIPVIQSITPIPSLAPLLGQNQELPKDEVSFLE